MLFDILWTTEAALIQLCVEMPSSNIEERLWHQRRKEFESLSKVQKEILRAISPTHNPSSNAHLAEILLAPSCVEVCNCLEELQGLPFGHVSISVLHRSLLDHSKTS